MATHLATLTGRYMTLVRDRISEAGISPHPDNMDFAGEFWSLVELAPVKSIGVGGHTYLWKKDQVGSLCLRKETLLKDH